MKKTIAYLIKNRKQYQIYLILIIAFFIISTTGTLLIPIFLGRAIDNIIGINNVNFSAVVNDLIIIIVITILVVVFTWTSLFFVTKLVQKHLFCLRQKLFAKVEVLPLKYIDNSSKGDLVTRFSIDMETIGEGISQLLIVGIPGIFLIILTIGFLLYTNLIIGLIIIVLTPIAFLAVNFIASRNRHLFKSVATINGQMNGYANEIISGNRTLRSLNYQSKTFPNYQKMNSELQIKGEDSQFYSSMTGPMARLVNYIIYTIVGVTASLLLLSNPEILTIGMISRLLIYCKRYSSPFNDISSIINIITASSVSVERIENMLNLEEEKEGNNSIIINDFKDKIEFKGVYFRYQESVPLIENLNIEIKKGYKVAIVGPTGAGKSTIINLLLRFYDIDQGDILFDGSSIYQSSRQNLRRLFGLVLQDTYLFKGTISDNISFAKNGATKESIKEAAVNAYADHFISQLKYGYDTIIDEDGGNLSEGQKQLISIARIILLNPQILILDEATSNIDTRTEVLVQQAYNKMMAGKTSFIVAHRLSTIVEANLILVMRDGKVIEQGTHQELLSKPTFYQELYNNQFEV